MKTNTAISNQPSALEEVIAFADDRDNTDMGMRAAAELKELRDRLTLLTLENIKGASVLDDKNAELEHIKKETYAQAVYDIQQWLLENVDKWHGDWIMTQAEQINNAMDVWLIQRHEQL